MINLNLRSKIILLGVMAALVPILTSTFLVYKKEHDVNRELQKEIDNTSRDLIDRAADDAYSTIELSNALIQKHVDTALRMAHELLSQAGAVSFSGPEVTWNAVNQATMQTTPVSLPRFMVGNEWIKPNTSFQTKTPVVDKVTEVTLATCTVFQRMNTAGDMLRIATSVPNKDGNRAISTYIPAINPDGSKNTVIATVLSGQTYQGRAFVVNAWYLTDYEPLRNERGDVVGVLYVGVKQESVPTIRKILAETRVGMTGSIKILYGIGKGAGVSKELKGECIISKDGKEDGINFLDTKDADGKPYIQTILNDAINLKPYDNGEIHVPLRDPQSGTVHTELIQYQYFKPWDWVIIASAPEADFAAARETTHKELDSLLRWSGFGGFVGMLAAIWMALFISRRIATPITRVTEIAGRIASGNLIEAGQMAGAETCMLSAMRDENGTGIASERYAKIRDETGRLFCATRTMIDNLYSLISQVKTASIQLVSTATQISATSKQQEATVQNFGTSTSEIAAAVKEISATSQELLKTMDDVTTVAGQTGSQAAAAHTSIGGVEEAMRKLAQSTSSISSKLSVINEKANNIGSVITTITKIADQTNLLSLNAAIEAEKAGEYGLGFSVVAREIRRLADQTAVATLDIEQMIRQMQGSVSTGVMEMDKFSEEVRRGVQEASKLGQDFGKIIDQVQALTPRFEAVHEGMQAQSQGAQQINDAMLQLTESARQSAVSIREFNLAADQLHRAVQGLKEEVSKFKVS